MATPVTDDVAALQARVNALEQERRHLLTVVEIVEEMAEASHFGDIVQAVARRLGEAFGLDRCSIFLADRVSGTVRLVASYEDPAIRNYIVDLARYPELRRALEGGGTVLIPDVTADPALSAVRGQLAARRVKAITVVPISWRGSAVGAILLRTFQDAPDFSDADLRLCEVVAGLTARALHRAHRLERLQGRGGEPAATARVREQALLLSFLRRLLASYTPTGGEEIGDALAGAGSAELTRLVGVTRAVLSQEAAAR